MVYLHFQFDKGEKDMIVNFLKALCIGIGVTLPLGPVGILSIQKTISKGRWFGFATGLGASLMDLLYAAMALFSLAFISEFLDDNRNYVLLTGGVVIIVVGICVFFSNPVKALNQPSVAHTNRFSDALQGFLMTLGNPGALVLMLSLFAFVGIDPESFDVPMSMMMMLAGVFIGELICWIFITSVINLFRKKFSLRGLLLLNRISGTIIAACGCFAFFEGLYELVIL